MQANASSSDAVAVPLPITTTSVAAENGDHASNGHAGDEWPSGAAQQSSDVDSLIDLQTEVRRVETLPSRLYSSERKMECVQNAI